MSLTDGEDAPRRRRGEALEAALLDAAWAELVERGYGDFTIDGVAARAQTSRAVLYRRWPGKRELVAAAARDRMVRDRGPPPDLHGPLRDDLIALLGWANRMSAPTMLQLIVHLGPYLAEEAMTFGELRRLFLSGQGPRNVPLIERAVARGEVDPARVTPRIAALPFDLFRNELLLTGQPLSDDVIREIVDDIVVPLWTGAPKTP